MNITAIKNGAIHTGQSVPVPRHLATYLIKWATEVTCFQFGFGYVLAQVYPSRRFSANYYVFDLQSEADISFACDTDIVTLHYMLQGSMQCTWHGTNEVIPLEENTYRSFVVKAGEYKNNLGAGITQSLHFEFEPGFLSFIAEEFMALQQLIEGIHHEAYAFAALPARKIDFEVLNILKDYIVSTHAIATAQANLTLIINRLYHQYQLALLQENPLTLSTAFRQQLVDNIKADIKAGPHKEKHSYEYFAAKYATSEATIRRAFTQTGGCTMREFLHHQLMLKAQELTAHGKRLDEIALLLGYSDKSSLSNAMKTDRKSQPN